jgi:hypothetical protein
MGMRIDRRYAAMGSPTSMSDPLTALEVEPDEDALKIRNFAHFLYDLDPFAIANCQTG